MSQNNDVRDYRYFTLTPIAVVAIIHTGFVYAKNIGVDVEYDYFLVMFSIQLCSIICLVSSQFCRLAMRNEAHFTLFLIFIYTSMSIFADLSHPYTCKWLAPSTCPVFIHGLRFHCHWCKNIEMSSPDTT